MIILSAAVHYLYAGWMGYQVAPKLIEVRDSQSIISDPYTLSPEQKTNLISHGYPEASTILICEEESPDRGVQTVRLGTPGIANRPGNPYRRNFQGSVWARWILF